MVHNIAIVGAGISGLSSAYYLAKKSNGNIKSITVLEKSQNLGGVLNCTKENGYLLEHGAQGVLLSRESFYALLTDLNAAEEKITDKIIIPDRKNYFRYLIIKNSLVKLSPKIFTSGLFSIVEVIRVFAELFVKSPTRDGKKQVIISPNESLYVFFARRFGKKFANIFILPLSFGIWAGGARKILLRYAFPKLYDNLCGYGSVSQFLLSALPKRIFNKEKSKHGLTSFEGGMHFLIQKLSFNLQKECKKKGISLYIRTGANVKNISHENSKIHILTELETEVYDGVIYTAQPWRDMSPFTKVTVSNEINKALSILQNIPSHSIVVVGLGGKKTERTPRGFGALAEEATKDLLGVLFVHSIYPQHSPENSFLYRVLLGGEKNPDICKKTDTELIEIAKEQLLNISLVDKVTKYDFQKVVRWESYIPLATEKQDSILSSLWQLEALYPGLFFAGNYIKGPAVADCLEQAQQTAQNLLNYLK